MLSLKLTKSERLAKMFQNPIRKDVINIAWPVLIELLLGSLFGMVDMMMLGRISDTVVAASSVAAVGITNQPLFIGLSLVQALNVGGTAMIARYLGSKQTDRLETTLKHIVLLSQILLALPIAIIGITFTDSIMKLMGAEPGTVVIGRMYFKIIMAGFIFQSFNMSLSAALRGVGDTKIPMAVNLRVNFLNVIGNALLIYGLLWFPRLGVTGAAISSALSQVLASIFLLTYIKRGKSVITFNILKKFKIDKDVIYNLVKIGVPASLEQMAMRVGILFFVRTVAGLGTIVFAAHQICLSILGLSFQPGQAFSIATSSLVGRSLGRQKPKDAEEYAREARKIGSIISTLMALVFFIFGPNIVGLYTKDAEIIEKASIALKIIALVQPFQSSQLILAGGLRGAGDTVWTLVSTFTGVMIIRTFLAYVFVKVLGLGLSGAWIAVLVDQLIRWAIVYARFKTGRWKYITLR